MIGSSLSSIGGGNLINNLNGLVVDKLTNSLNIKYANFNGNKGNGIYLTDPSYLTYIINCKIYNNENGLHMSGSWQKIHIENTRIEKNSLNGIKIVSLAIYPTQAIKSFLIGNVITDQVYGAGIDLNNKVDSIIESNKFTNNFYDILLTGLSYNYGSKVVIRSNNFELSNNVSSYAITMFNIDEYEIIDNIKINSKGGFFKDFRNMNSERKAMLKNNTIFNCLTIVSLIDINNLLPKGMTEIFGNKIKNNIPFSDKGYNKFDLFPNYILTSIRLVSAIDTRIKSNEIYNPDFPFEMLAIPSRTTDLKVDASENFWGNRNPYEQVIGRHMIFTGRPVNLNPSYYDSLFTRELNHTYSLDYLNNDLGGDIDADIVLKKGVYELKGALRIKKDAKVIVEKGVEIQAWPNTGIEVYGSLEFQGQEQDDIVLDLKKSKIPNVSHGYNNVVEIELDSTTYTICNTRDLNVMNALCQSLGFSEKKYSSYQSRSVRKGIELVCPSVNFRSCKTQRSDCSYVLQLTCHDRKWMGISYLVNSRPSLVQGLTIYNAGLFDFDLYFELLRHKLKNIHIKTKSPYNIKVQQTIMDEMVTLENLNITSLVTTQKTEIETRSLRVTGSSFTNTQLMFINSKTIKFTTRNFNRDVEMIHNYHCPRGHYTVKKNKFLTLHIKLDRAKTFNCNLRIIGDEGTSLKFIAYGSNNRPTEDFMKIKDIDGTIQAKLPWTIHISKDNRATVYLKKSYYNVIRYYLVIYNIEVGGKLK